MDYEGLGRRIRVARHELSLTQEKLSELSSISLSFLGHIERGTRIPSIETLVLIANALNCSLDMLMQDSLRYKGYNSLDQNSEGYALLIEINKVVSRWNQ